MDNLIHRSLEGRYRIEQLLGAGGMANVYKGTDMQTGKLVAVKVLKQEYVNNPDLVRRFKNEAKAISLLNHPNITKVYDVSVSDELQYIVMEYIEGITLKEYMEYRAKALTYKETVHFIMQILAALQHAHDKGIVHRDIKPQNIMLLADGTIKVMDFGIARFSRSESRTITDKAIGSVHYISPEQARGNPTDLRADLYSVGVMMYEMLSGTLPFESDSPVSVAIKQISEEAKPLRELNPAVPEALAAITARAMAKDPAERYPSAREMMADLEEFKKNPNSAKRGLRPQPSPPQADEPTRCMPAVQEKENAHDSSENMDRTRVTGVKPVTQKKKTAPKQAKKRSLFLPILAGVAVAFAIGAAILVAVIFNSSSSNLFKEHQDVELPNFTNTSIDDVLSNDAYDGFTFEKIEQYNGEVEQGVIFNQSPKPPKTVKDNATIKLYVSKGAQMVSLPNLIGKTKTEAMKVLSESGIVFRIETEQTKETTPGNVLRMDPAPGTQVKAGSSEDSVVLVVSREEIERYQIPSFVGQLVDDVKAKLNDYTQNPQNFRIGTVTEQENTAPKGTILSQTPTEGTEAIKGSAINVVVSSGVVPMTRHVTVVFDETVDEGLWSLVLDGGTTVTHPTVAGRAENWEVDFTDTGAKLLTLLNPAGVPVHVTSVNFGPDGINVVVGPIGGSTPRPGDSSQPQPGGDSNQGNQGDSGQTAQPGGDSSQNQGDSGQTAQPGGASNQNPGDAGQATTTPTS